jgi:hypothetical protein
MIKYNVIWTSETKSGCITVFAKNVMGAIANARETLQMGNSFRVVRVYEGR